jgi:dihydrofolate reductase/thymidylate synthase
MSKPFDIIVAATSINFGIGREGTLPWRLKTDMSFFKRVTTMTNGIPGMMNAVIMGRKTYESIPAKFRPLEGRINVVLSRNPSVREELSLPAEVLVAGSLDEALEQVSGDARIAQTFVLGGGSVYKEAVESKFCAHVFMTAIFNAYENIDTCFPELTPENYTLKSCSQPVEENGTRFSFAMFENTKYQNEISGGNAASEGGDLLDGLFTSNPMSQASVCTKFLTSMNQHPEMQYLNLIRDVMENGVVRSDRTGTGTISKFGATMRYSLRNDEFPLLTTKRVFWRGVAEELLWFVNGSTNAKLLQEKNIKIWDGNASREFLDSRGLTEREEGDLGPVYGFQWRHFGADYDTMHGDYTGKGVDQLARVIDTIKNNPTDRRILLSAWNPAALDLMALPPCHMFAQFYVANGEVSCQMYQRSADLGLGVPFNIASYALLTRMIADVCGLKAGEFVHVMGDAHVYLNHREALNVQLCRAPRPFPRLTIKESAEPRDIDGFVFEDFTVHDYQPHKTIKMEMAV